MIRFLRTKTTPNGDSLHVFLINGAEREVRERDLKQHPGCFEALPAQAKAQAATNVQWLAAAHGVSGPNAKKK